jgi:hypothetical protein
MEKNSVPVYDVSFNRTVDLNFSCDKVVCVFVCLFYHPIYSVDPTLSLAFLSFLKSLDRTYSSMGYSFYLSNSFCPSTTLERYLSQISSCTVVRSLAFDLFPSFYYHIGQLLTICALSYAFFWVIPPGVCSLNVNVSEHSVCSIFIGE